MLEIARGGSIQKSRLAALEARMKGWLPGCMLSATFEHHNPNAARLIRADVKIIRELEKLCEAVDPDCADTRKNKLRWAPAAMKAGGNAQDLAARITFRCKVR